VSRLSREPEFRELKFHANGLRLHCLDYGGEGKPPIIFLHGGSAHSHWWDFVAPAFTDRYHALALDQRGHGDSEWPPEWAYGTRHYVSDLETIVSTWTLGRPILVGHSMGAHNTLVFATRNADKVRAIAAIDTPPDYSERAVEFLRHFSKRPPRRFESLAEAIKSFRLLPRETIAKQEILDHVARFTFKRDEYDQWIHKIDRRTMVREPLDLADEDLARIACPALIVKVNNSPLLDIAIARRMAESIPHGTLAEIDHGNHHIMLDNPDAVIKTLHGFFDRLG